MPPRFTAKILATALIAAVILLSLNSRAETVSIVIASNAAPRVLFGAEKLLKALRATKLEAMVTHSPTNVGRRIVVGKDTQTELWRLIKYPRFSLSGSHPKPEGFFVTATELGDAVVVASDDSGLLYGCLELSRQILESNGIPAEKPKFDAPQFKLRGTCVGIQKTYILPGRKVYEYPYTPELFPWFYDKALWTEYLDMLVANRMNTLYLWNGHPFASLVKLKDYPEAVEVPDDVFAQNVEMFHWLTSECDKRGIWLVQMFYNIFLPKPLAEKHGVSTQLSAPTPLASDYTRKSIAEFVRQYPNVGLLVCLGEALQGTENQINWATNTILPGVLDGMRAAGLKEQPPVVIRTHAMNPEAIMPACFQVYSNLFTMTKYNGESLTTYEPRGKVQQTHLNMAKLGPHIVNVHILANLEPFRYGATEFIKKCVQASRDRYGASGLHLYPLSYWNWPYSPDIADPPLKQWDRDQIWFEAWARYAWNPDIPEDQDRAYWIGRLADFYGCDTNSAGKILDAYNDAGQIAPMLLRRFGITDGNRQTLSLGMTLDQLVNPNKYGAVKDLWECMSPPGERLDEYVRKEMNNEPHVGETPESAIRATAEFATQAQSNLAAVESQITRNQAEFKRQFNDVGCIVDLAIVYETKVRAAEAVLGDGFAGSGSDKRSAEEWMQMSLDMFKRLARRNEASYHFANSMQTGHRKIPFPGAIKGVGTNFLWSQVMPLYERELSDFQTNVAKLKAGEKVNLFGTNAPVRLNEANPEIAEPK